MMISKNKLLISGMLTAIVLVAGIFAFTPVDKATTIHPDVIAAIIGDPGVTNQDISEELNDKLKLMAATDDDVLVIGNNFPPGTITGFTITVNATNANNELVLFNLKEVYLCGSDAGDDETRIAFVHIENVILNSITGAIDDADITITSTDGGSLGIDIIDEGDTCVDIVSALANSGRAGAVGLGSDSNLVIELSGDDGDSIDFLKCIAFTPNEAETLACDLRPIVFGIL